MAELSILSGLGLGFLVGCVLGFVVIGLGFRRYINNLRDRAVGTASDFAIDTAKTVGAKGYRWYQSRKTTPTEKA